MLNAEGGGSMKKQIRVVLALVLMLPLMMVLSACSLFGSGVPGLVGPQINNQDDLMNAGEDNMYRSKRLNLVTEINGSYKIDRSFELDPQDENKRIYNDLYLYKYDYFYMTTNDNKYIWCRLSDKSDLDYVTVEQEMGEDIQINVNVTGKYKLIFDIVTKAFDIEYLGEVTTPVYEEIEDCEVGYLVDVNGKEELQFAEMQVVGDELALMGMHFAVGQSVGFYSTFTHTSWYKTTIEESCVNKYLYKIGEKPSTNVYFMIGGQYNIYLNPKTYVVRAELVAADENGYGAYVFVDENLNLVALELVNEDVNYEFEFQCRVVSQVVGNTEIVIENLPEIYNAKYQKYHLVPTAESLDLLRESTSKDGLYYFRKAGTYRLMINLKTFEIGVELMPE